MKTWKDIPGYEGLYQASTDGEIKSIERIVSNGFGRHLLKERILKPIPNGTGYFCVCLRKDGKTNRLYVHRLVALTFVKTDNYSLEVNHIDGIRDNNSVLNLEWVTRSENHFHRYKTLNQSGVNTGKRGELNWRSKPVTQYKDGEYIKSYPGASEAARQTGFTVRGISRAASGERKSYMGYEWKYDL